MNQNVIILPEWMVGLNFYNGQLGAAISIGDRSLDSGEKCIIGLSMGALIALKSWNGNSNLILVNPPLPKRNLLAWLVQWARFVFKEGLFFKRQKFTKNPVVFIAAVIKCLSLLSMDFADKLGAIPSDKLIVIKGRHDNYFCDKTAVDFLQRKKIKVIECENSGHNWSENIEQVVEELIK